MFSEVLAEFLFRLTFGVAAAMGLTPARWVTSGFFRVHLWVLLGLQTLAALASYSHASHSLASNAQAGGTSPRMWLAVAAAAVSYAGAVIWMYESRLAGKMAVWIVAACALAASLYPVLSQPGIGHLLQVADRVTGGLLLGLVTAAMLLGHWYLNTPTMKLEPLQRLIVFLALAVLARMAVSGAGLWLESAARSEGLAMTALLFLALRWLAGLLGVLALAGLTWQTLKIPNTQSATGILYAAVILAFIGELMSQLLTSQARYPV